MTATMATDELVRLLQHGEPVTVLDIRRATDRSDWSIPGSMHVDAYDEVRMGSTERLDALALPADGPVVVVCNAGVTSRPAAEALARRGLDARSLEGGMLAWSTAWNALDVTTPGANASIIQVRRLGKGCLSYVVASGGAAAVIDPSLDHSVYVGLCRAHNWRITHVLDTHVHADHVSRARALAQLVGAVLVAPSGGRLAFDVHEPADGETLTIGDASIQVLATPGHTPESVCYLVDGRALLSGDTLFPTTVGRPDLATDDAGATSRARALVASVRRMLALDDSVLVLPCHGDELTVDEPALSTIGSARSAIDLPTDDESFVASVLKHLPPTPPNHLQIVALNESGRATGAAQLEQLEAGANRCAVPVG